MVFLYDALPPLFVNLDQVVAVDHHRPADANKGRIGELLFQPAQVHGDVFLALPIQMKNAVIFFGLYIKHFFGTEESNAVAAVELELIG